MQNNKKPGYAIISIVLVLGVLVTLLGITVAGTSINFLQTSLAGAQGGYSSSLVHGCAELALLQLNADGTLPTSITTPTGNCSIVTNSQSGNTWNFTVSGTFKTHLQTANIEAQRTSTLTITSWQKI